jgi:hypothetical protein
MGWVSTKDKQYPDRQGKWEHVPCLVIRKGQILIRPWNSEHLVWDDEDGDDFFCDASEISYWMLLSDLPEP